MANPPTDRMGGFLVRYWKGIRHLFVVVTCIVSFGLPLQALVSTEDGMWQELAVTELGQYLPDTSITWETFVCASVRFLTFEKAEDPLAIAKKHGYLPAGDMSEQITYKEAIDFVLRLIGAEADGAQSLGIMDYPFHPKQTVSTAQAGELLARERLAWYSILESESSQEPIRAADYYLTSSTFKFSADETKLVFDAAGLPQVVELNDGARLPFDPDLLAQEQQEALPTIVGQSLSGVYG